MNKRHFLLLLPLLSLLACGEEDSNLFPNPNEISVSFSSVVTGSTSVRASGTSWDNGDVIGVYALTHQSVLSEQAIVDNSRNLPFETKGDGVFRATAKQITYPDANNPIDIIAYYPHNDNISGFDYPIDIAQQHEVFYSNNISGLSIDNGSNNSVLVFIRPLSRIVFDIATKDSDASLDGLSVQVEGAKMRGVMSLVDGAVVPDDQSVGVLPLNVSDGGSGKVASAMLLPTGEGNVITLRFALNGEVFVWRVPNALVGGKSYRYSIVLDGVSSSVEKTSSYMEIPVYAGSGDAPNSVSATHFARRSWLSGKNSSDNPDPRNYTVMFDTNNRVPYWVAYPLHAAYMDSGNRTDDWQYDPAIASSLQPALFSGWSGSNIDRGHLLASADRSASTDINRTTFYFTNMAPQNSKMNQGPWNKFENTVRTWSAQGGYDTLYVVTGCILPKSPEPFTYTTDNNNVRSVIPKYIYKALLRKKLSTGDYTSIVFKMENADTGSQYSDTQNILSVAELEAETGFTFFPNLPANVASAVKQNKTISPDWN